MAKSKETSNLSKIDSLIMQVDKKYGKGTIIRASAYPPLARISTGIFALDMEIGGGIPKGRIVMFSGNESTCKSTAAQRVIVEAQRTCRVCNGVLVDGECPSCGENGGPHVAAYIDLEGTFDPIWFSCLGGDNESLYLVQPDFAEQGVDVTEALIRTGEVDVLVVDSLAMMSPAVEIEKSSEDLLVGTAAKLTNRFMRAIASGVNSLGMLNARKPSIILINQIREKVGVMFGTPETMPGGRGQRFAASIHVKFFARPSEQIYETIGDKKAVGQQFRFSVQKNKTFPPHREGIFTMYMDDSEEYGMRKCELDTLAQIIRYGVRYAVVDKTGAWFSYRNIKGHGESNFIQAFMEQPDLIPVMQEEIRLTVESAIWESMSGKQEDS